MSALKLFISFWLLVISLFITTPVFAQNTIENSNKQISLYITNIAHLVSCTGTGVSLIGLPCSPAENSQNYSRGGLLGVTLNSIYFLYSNPPISGTQYLAGVIKEGVHLGKPAYAQVGGTGYAAIKPVENLWRVFRDISYLGFIIVFVATGLMIMFRQKINPQTVIGIQNALPGLVIGLILVTFSFFITGLIVDLAYILSQFLGIAVLLGLNPGIGAGDAITKILDQRNIFTIFGDFALGDLGGLWNAASDIGKSIGDPFSGAGPRAFLGLISGLIVLLQCLPLIVGTGALSAGAAVPFVAAGCFLGGGAAGALGPESLIPLIIFGILLFALISALFKLFFALLSSYVSIVLSTIFAPFLILFSSLPGRGNILNQWFLGLLSNVLVFPAVFGVFIIVAAILNKGDLWPFAAPNPPAVGKFDQPLPLFGGMAEDFIRYILAYGILLAAPGVPDFIKNLIAKPTGQQLGQAVQQSTQAGQGRVVGIGGRLAKLPSLFKKP